MTQVKFINVKFICRCFPAPKCVCVCVWPRGSASQIFVLGAMVPPALPSMIVVVYHNLLQVTVTTCWGNDSLLFLTSCKWPDNTWSDLYVRYMFHCTYSIRTFSDNMELHTYSLEFACIVSSSVKYNVPRPLPGRDCLWFISCKPQPLSCKWPKSLHITNRRFKCTKESISFFAKKFPWQWNFSFKFSPQLPGVS